MTQPPLVDTRSDFSRPFKGHSPLAHHLGQVIHDIIDTSGLTVSAAAELLGCSYLANILCGAQSPSPHYMRINAWLPKLEAQAQALFVKESHGGFLKNYVSECSCTQKKKKLLVDPRDDYSRPFSPLSPMAEHMGHVIREIVDASGKPRSYAKKKLDCSGLSTVMSGKWIPTPYHMRTYNWPKKLKALAPDVFEREEFGDFLERYANEKDCSTPPDRQRIVRTRRRKSSRLQDAQDACERAIGELQNLAKILTEPQAKGRSADAYPMAQREEDPYLRPFTQAAKEWGGQDLATAIRLIMTWPSLWNKQDAFDQDDLIHTAQTHDDGLVENDRWHEAVTAFVVNMVETNKPQSDLCELYRNTCSASRKGKKKNGFVLTALSQGNGKNIPIPKIVKALSWLHEKLEESEPTPENKLRIAALDTLMHVEPVRTPDGKKLIRFIRARHNTLML